MFSLKAAATVALLSALTSPANAALVLDKSGPMADLFRYYDSEFVATVGAFGIYGPQSNGSAVSFATPAKFDTNGEPNAPWVAKGPLMHYDILLTTSSPLLNARGAPGIADWYDIYDKIGDDWVYTGGNDNVGGYYMNCENTFDCGTIPVVGNTARLSFTFQDTVTWAEGFGGYVIDLQTYNFAQIAGEIPIDALDGRYRIQVFASAVPEPQTWTLLITGFAALGIRLRKKHIAKA
jgi:hypothetical protein